MFNQSYKNSFLIPSVSFVFFHFRVTTGVQTITLSYCFIGNTLDGRTVIFMVDIECIIEKKNIWFRPILSFIGWSTYWLRATTTQFQRITDWETNKTSQEVIETMRISSVQYTVLVWFNFVFVSNEHTFNETIISNYYLLGILCIFLVFFFLGGGGARNRLNFKHKKSAERLRYNDF